MSHPHHRNLGSKPIGPAGGTGASPAPLVTSSNSSSSSSSGHHTKKAGFLSLSRPNWPGRSSNPSSSNTNINTSSGGGKKGSRNTSAPGGSALSGSASSSSLAGGGSGGAGGSGTGSANSTTTSLHSSAIPSPSGGSSGRPNTAITSGTLSQSPPTGIYPVASSSSGGSSQHRYRGVSSSVTEVGGSGSGSGSASHSNQHHPSLSLQTEPPYLIGSTSIDKTNTNSTTYSTQTNTFSPVGGVGTSNTNTPISIHHQSLPHLSKTASRGSVTGSGGPSSGPTSAAPVSGNQSPEVAASPEMEYLVPSIGTSSSDPTTIGIDESSSHNNMAQPRLQPQPSQDGGLSVRSAMSASASASSIHGSQQSRPAVPPLPSSSSYPPIGTPPGANAARTFATAPAMTLGSQHPQSSRNPAPTLPRPVSSRYGQTSAQYRPATSTPAGPGASDRVIEDLIRKISGNLPHNKVKHVAISLNEGGYRAGSVIGASPSNSKEALVTGGGSGSVHGVGGSRSQQQHGGTQSLGGGRTGGRGGGIEGLDGQGYSQEEMIGQACRSLSEASRWNISKVLEGLVKELEAVVTKIDDQRTRQVGLPDMQTLRSQYYLVRAISLCTISHWHSYRQMHQQNQQRNGASDAAADSSDNLSTGRDWIDPPPLGDFLAKRIVFAACSLLRQNYEYEGYRVSAGAAQQPGAPTPAPGAGPPGSAAPLHGHPSMSSVASAVGQPAPKPKPPLSPAEDAFLQQLMYDIFSHVGKIIFYVSASNWKVVFARLQVRFRSYALEETDPAREAADLGEMRLLEGCSLNRMRLGDVLRELASSFMNFKRTSQSAMAVVLRKAIWGYIETFPLDFSRLYGSSSSPTEPSFSASGTANKIDGRSAETLFDIFAGLAESTKRRTPVWWPVMAMLLVGCPDIMEKLVLADVYNQTSLMAGRSGMGALTKKAAFLEAIRKALKSQTKNGDVAIACYVDLCRAATYTEMNVASPSSLRLLASDMEVEIRAKLFTLGQPFRDTEGQIPVSLISDAIIAFCGLESVYHLFDEEARARSCGPEGPLEYRLGGIKAYLHIQSQEGALPWNLTLQDTYRFAATYFRHAFMETVFSRDAFSDPSQPQLAVRTEIILTFLQVVEARPSLAYWRTPGAALKRGSEQLELYALGLRGKLLNGDYDPHDPMSFIATLLFLSNDGRNRVLSNAAASALMVLYEHSSDKLDPQLFEDPFFTLMATRPVRVCSHFRQLIEAKTDLDQENSALQLILFDRQLGSQGHPQESVGPLLNIPQVARPLDAVIQIALLIALTTIDVQNFNLALTLVHQFKKYTHAVRDSGFYWGLDQPNIFFADEEGEFVASAGTGGSISVLGRVVQQRRYTKFLHKLREPTTAILAAWDEVYRRWKVVSAALGQDAHDEESEEGSISLSIYRDTPFEDKLSEWSNLTSFLTALCHLSIRGADDGTPSLSEVFDPNMMSLPARFFRARDRKDDVQRFLHTMVDLLVADTPKVREFVKTALGQELSPQLFPMLLGGLQGIVAHFFDKVTKLPTIAEPYTEFIEQSVGMFRYMFERLNEPLDPEATLNAEGLITAFTSYIQRLGTKRQALIIKWQMCNLCNIVLSKSDLLEIGQSQEFRCRLLEHLAPWGQEWSLVPRWPLEDGDMDAFKLHRDLMAVNLNVVASLLDGLVVQPADSIGQEVGPKTDGRMFSKLFDYLWHGFHLVAAWENTVKSRDKSRSKSDANIVDPARMRDIFREFPKIRERTVLALAHLVSANPNPAYQRLLEMGRSNDTAARNAHLQVLAKVLQTGTTFDAIEEVPVDECFTKLADLICQPDLSLALAMCDVCASEGTEDMTEVFFDIFESRQGVKQLLKAVLEREILDTDHPATLFRGNSFATRLLTTFARARGYDYLRSTLRNLVYMLSNKPADHPVDFDAAAGVESPYNQEVARNLELVAQNFVDVITTSWREVPSDIRDICNHIRTVVQIKFSDSVYPTIGGFFFLRFMNPAIVSPETIDLDLPNDRPDVRRGLLMVTKILQALSNNILFGAKEPIMRLLNSFMEKGIVPVTSFLKSISSGEDLEEDNVHRQLGEPRGSKSVDEYDRQVLHIFLFHCMGKIGQLLLTGKVVKAYRHFYDGSESLSTPNARKVFEDLTNVVSTLGSAPAGSQTPTPLSAEGYTNFMNRNDGRSSWDAEFWKAVCYEGPKSRDNNPTIYFLPGEIRADTADLESFLYYVLKLISRRNRPIEFLIDCTRFSTSNELPVQWAKLFFALAPQGGNFVVHRVCLYNCNFALQRYLQRVGKQIWGKDVDHRLVIVLDSWASLLEYHPKTSTNLPAHTTSAARERRTSFEDITRLYQYTLQAPVVIGVGTETIQITTGKKLPLLGTTVKAPLTDIFSLADIEDVRKTRYGVDEPGFAIKLEHQVDVLKFIVREDLATLFDTLNSNRLRLHHTMHSQAPIRLLRPRDVSGALLNIALFNLCSEEPELRLSAYNLLSSFTQAFPCKDPPQLLGSTSLFIPPSPVSLCSSVSEKMATSFPQFTYSFLQEFFEFVFSAPPAQAQAYIYCLRPWLTNLSDLRFVPRDEYEQNQSTLRKIMRQMIRLSTRDGGLFPTVQKTVWPAMMKNDHLIPILIDEVVQAAVAYDFTSKRSESIIGIVGAFTSSVDVRTKIVYRLHQTLVRTCHSDVTKLSDSPDWQEICVLVRMDLMMSFGSGPATNIILPEIFHNVTMLVGTGPTEFRRSIHSLVVNLVQALASSSPPEHHLTDVIALHKTLNMLVGSTGQDLFGLNNVERQSDENMIAASCLEALIPVLLDIIKQGAPSNDAANAWRARWMSLVASTCFQNNPPLQIRAFLVLGFLAWQEVDEDMIYQILATLGGLLAHAINGEGGLPASILVCLSRVMLGLDRHSSNWYKVFWMSIGFLQIAWPPVFNAAVRLIRVTIKNLAAANFFAPDGRRGASDMLIDVREACGLSIELDAEVGIAFNHSFSFSLAACLLKGLKLPVSQDDVFGILWEIFEIFSIVLKDCEGSDFHLRRHVDPELAGFFVALFPCACRTNQLPRLFQLAHLEAEPDISMLEEMPRVNEPVYFPIYNTLMPEDSGSATFIAGLVLSMLETCEGDLEKTMLLGLLEEIALGRFSAVTTSLHDRIVPFTRSITAISENITLLDLAHRLTIITTPDRPGSAASHAKTNNAIAGGFDAVQFLDDIGFRGLLEGARWCPRPNQSTRQRDAEADDHDVDTEEVLDDEEKGDEIDPLKERTEMLCRLVRDIAVG